MWERSRCLPSLFTTSEAERDHLGTRIDLDALRLRLDKRFLPRLHANGTSSLTSANNDVCACACACKLVGQL